VHHEGLLAEILLQNLAEKHDEPILLRYPIGKEQVGIRLAISASLAHGDKRSARPS
jgi:hypothetical protein